MVVQFLDTDKFDCLVNSAGCEDFVVFSDTSSCAIVRMGDIWSVSKQCISLLKCAFPNTLLSWVHLISSNSRNSACCLSESEHMNILFLMFWNHFVLPWWFPVYKILPYFVIIIILYGNKYDNSELYFSEQNLTTVELGIINYQSCKLALFLASDCACFTGVLTYFCVTHWCFFLIRNLERHAIKSVKIMSFI